MPTGQFDIPALPVLLALGFVVMAVTWVLLRRRGEPSAWRLGAAWLAGWYAVAVLGATMLPMRLAWGASAGDLEPYRIILVPLITMRVGDFLLNIVMTLPLAVLLRVVFGVRERARVVLAGFLLSAVIEVTQAILDLTLHGNRWADVNDLISNTLGALLGWWALDRLLRVRAVRRIVTRASAPPARAGAPTT